MINEFENECRVQKKWLSLSLSLSLSLDLRSRLSRGRARGWSAPFGKYHSFCRHLSKSEIGMGPDAPNYMLSAPRYLNHPGNGPDFPRLGRLIAALFLLPSTGLRNSGHPDHLTGLHNQFAHSVNGAQSDARLAHGRFVIGDEQHAFRAVQPFVNRCFFRPSRVREAMIYANIIASDLGSGDHAHRKPWRHCSGCVCRQPSSNISRPRPAAPTLQQLLESMDVPAQGGRCARCDSGQIVGRSLHVSHDFTDDDPE